MKGVKVMKTAYAEITPYTTKDGSLIRELMHPAVHGNKQVSFAEAIIGPGALTLPHIHKSTEEIYHVVEGVGVMRLGAEKFFIGPGDTICIVPGSLHSVENTGSEPLKIFCCCSPPYSHEDTEMCPEIK